MYTPLSSVNDTSHSDCYWREEIEPVRRQTLDFNCIFPARMPPWRTPKTQHTLTPHPSPPHQVYPKEEEYVYTPLSSVNDTSHYEWAGEEIEPVRRQTLDLSCIFSARMPPWRTPKRQHTLIPHP